MVDDSVRYTVKKIIGYGGTGETIYQTKDGGIWQTAYPESMGMWENVGRGSGVEVKRLYH